MSNFENASQKTKPENNNISSATKGFELLHEATTGMKTSATKLEDGGEKEQKQQKVAKKTALTKEEKKLKTIEKGQKKEKKRKSSETDSSTTESQSSGSSTTSSKKAQKTKKQSNPHEQKKQQQHQKQLDGDTDDDVDDKNAKKKNENDDGGDESEKIVLNINGGGDASIANQKSENTKEDGESKHHKTASILSKKQEINKTVSDDFNLSTLNTETTITSPSSSSTAPFMGSPSLLGDPDSTAARCVMKNISIVSSPLRKKGGDNKKNQHISNNNLETQSTQQQQQQNGIVGDDNGDDENVHKTADNSLSPAPTIGDNDGGGGEIQGDFEHENDTEENHDSLQGVERFILDGLSSGKFLLSIKLNENYVEKDDHRFSGKNRAQNSWPPQYGSSSAMQTDSASTNSHHSGGVNNSSVTTISGNAAKSSSSVLAGGSGGSEPTFLLNERKRKSKKEAKDFTDAKLQYFREKLLGDKIEVVEEGSKKYLKVTFKNSLALQQREVAELFGISAPTLSKNYTSVNGKVLSENKSSEVTRESWPSRSILVSRNKIKDLISNSMKELEATQGELDAWVKDHKIIPVDGDETSVKVIQRKKLQTLVKELEHLHRPIVLSFKIT